MISEAKYPPYILGRPPGVSSNNINNDDIIGTNLTEQGFDETFTTPPKTINQQQQQSSSNTSKKLKINTVKTTIALKSDKMKFGYEYSTKPLDYWKKNQYKYPVLSKFALKYLAVCATSVPSERLFSTAKRVINSSIANLSTETAEIMVLLSCWQKEIGKEAREAFF